MQRPRNNHSAPHRPPRGFTMLELLVVMGIIVFLVSITVAVVGKALTGAKNGATKATITTINGLLTQRMNSFEEARKAQNLKGQTLQIVMQEKNLFKAAFPQTLAEIMATDPSVLSSYDPTMDNPITQSSEAMYLFLTQMQSFGGTAVDEDAFNSSQVQDTDGDGLKEFVDGWGQPLRFYRWPTRLIRPASTASTAQSINTNTGNYTIPVISGPTAAYFGQTGHDASIFFGAIPGPLNEDPQDQHGWIQARTFNNTSFTLANFENNFHTPNTWSLPLVVSAGQDGVLGLHEATDTANFGHLAQPDSTQLDGILDNISNRNLTP